jgi:hypothetical protein
MPVAENCLVVPAAAEADEGATWIEVRVGVAALAEERHRARQPPKRYAKEALKVDQGITPSYAWYLFLVWVPAAAEADEGATWIE